MSAMLPLAYSVILFLSGTACGFFMWLWYRGNDESTGFEFRRHSQKLREAVKHEQDHSANLQKQLSDRLMQLRSLDELNHQLAKKLKQTQKLYLSRDASMKAATHRGDVTLGLLAQERAAQNRLHEELEHARQELKTLRARQQQRDSAEVQSDQRQTQLRVVTEETDEPARQQSVYPGNSMQRRDRRSLNAYIDPVLGKLYRSRPAQVDDLRKIAGISNVLQRKLHELGVYAFEQIMHWDDAAITSFSELLDMDNDRVEHNNWVDRHNWVRQARNFHEQKYKAENRDQPDADSPAA